MKHLCLKQLFFLDTNTGLCACKDKFVSFSLIIFCSFLFEDPYHARNATYRKFHTQNLS